MNDFCYRDGQLWCENVPVQKVAAKIGTPFYLYSYQTLKNHFTVFDKSFAAVDHLICFSVKSNSNIAVLRTFILEGSGVDIVSGGELYRALKAGVDPQKVVYSGVGKRIDEIEYALKTGILMFNIESFQELETINACARRLTKKAGIALRINPDVNPQTHSHISTGLKENKFGIPMQQALEVYMEARTMANIEIKGVSCHIGSQITSLSPFLEALTRLKKIIEKLKTDSITVKYLDLGGGLGVNYSEETPPHPAEYADAVIKAAADLNCTFILEPGRVLVGNAGILVTQILYTKANEGKNFLVVDAGMNDLMRPNLYQAYHHIQPVVQFQRERMKADIVGPICESSDFLAKGRQIERAEPGELLSVMSAGAYGFSMSSNYNSRPRTAEVLVKDNRFYVIRRRENYADLDRKEKIPAFLNEK